MKKLWALFLAFSAITLMAQTDRGTITGTEVGFWIHPGRVQGESNADHERGPAL
jgi:hypothetical protein